MESEKNEIKENGIKGEESNLIDVDNISNEIKEMNMNMNKTDKILKEAKQTLLQIKEQFSQKKLKRNKYILKEKEAFIILMENKITKHFIENEYGISRKTLREWESNKDILSKK